jgi:hypothetical protein
MTLWRWGIFVCLAALPLPAAMIDVTGQTQVTLGPGDALAFTFSASSYLAYAAQYQTPPYPTAIDFRLIAADLPSTLDFTAELQSGNGLTSVTFGDVAVSAGWFHGALFNGTVSAVSGSANLAPDIAAEIFSGPAILVLRNASSSVTVDLPPYRLAQEMVVSVEGGGLSVGGVIDGISLEQAPATFDQAGDPSLDAMGNFLADGPQDVPEPSSGLLLAGGAALLLALGAVLKRFKRAGLERIRTLRSGLQSASPL